jgi:hypothetical protein
MLQYLGIIKDLGSLIAKPFTQAQERKAAKESGEIKLRQMKETGDTNIKLTDAEWEAIAARGMQSSWKDEYLTIIIPLPIPMIIIGGVYQAFTEDSRLIDGTIAGIQALGQIGVDMNLLMSAVVLSGVGLKIWRSR